MANRVTQEAVEAVLSPTDAKARVTQEVVEVVVAPTALARTSQLPVEVLLSPTDGKARVTQIPVEVLVGGQPPARFTQLPVEVLYAPLPPDPPEGAFAEAVLALNPWVYYKLGDPGAQAWDYSANARHGTYFGSPVQQQAGALVAFDDGAVLLDAVDDYVRNDAGIFNSAPFTMLVFFHYDGTPPGANAFLAGLMDGLGSGTHSTDLYLLTDGKVQGYIYDGGTKFVTAPGALAAGWHLLGLRADGSTLDLWIDGVEVASIAAGNAFTGYSVPNVFVGGATNTFPRRAGKRDEFILIADDISDAAMLELYELSQEEAPSGSVEKASLGGIGIGAGSVSLEHDELQGIQIGGA